MSCVRIFPSGVRKLWVDHRVATGQLDLHVVDDAVHLCDRVALGLQLLPGEFQRNLAGGVQLASDELQLHEQSRRAAGVVVAVFTRLGRMM